MKKRTVLSASLHAALIAAAFSVALPAAAHTGGAHATKAPGPVSDDEHPFGRQGKRGNTTRTIVVNMDDMMRFRPAHLRITQGETIRFVVKNGGKIMHEMVLGTMEELKAHGEMMKKHPDMEHDEPYMAHVGPGRKEEMVWQFTRAGEFYYACLVPGHFEAGMIGKITVKPKT